MIGDGHLQLTETNPGAMSVIAALNSNFQAIDETNPWSRAGHTSGEAMTAGDLVMFGADGKLYKADGTTPVVGCVEGDTVLDGPARLNLMGEVAHAHAQAPGTVAYLDLVTAGASTASAGGQKVGVYGPNGTLLLFPFCGW